MNQIVTSTDSNYRYFTQPLTGVFEVRISQKLLDQSLVGMVIADFLMEMTTYLDTLKTHKLTEACLMILNGFQLAT